MLLLKIYNSNIGARFNITIFTYATSDVTSGIYTLTSKSKKEDKQSFDTIKMELTSTSDVINIVIQVWECYRDVKIMLYPKSINTNAKRVDIIETDNNLLSEILVDNKDIKIFDDRINEIRDEMEKLRQRIIELDKEFIQLDNNTSYNDMKHKRENVFSEVYNVYDM